MIGLFRTPSADAALTEALGHKYNRHELRMIERMSTTVELNEGQILTTEGASGREVLLLIDGTAAVSRDGDVIASVGPGDVIGEIAVLKNQPRNATVMATTAVTVAVFTRLEFLSLIALCPRLDQQFHIVADQRSAA